MLSKSFIFIFVSIIWGTYFLSNAQQIVKPFSTIDSKIGGECLLIKSIIDNEGQIARKTFEVDVKSSGNYYLYALQLSGFKNKYKVKINGIHKGVLETVTGSEGLESLNFSETNGLLSLSKGVNKITFESDNLMFPQIDYISLRLDNSKSAFDLTEIKKEMTDLKSKNLKNYNKDLARKEWESLSNKSLLKSATIIPGFPKNYDYAFDVNYKYTYFTYLNLTAGQTITLETYNSNCDPVMELINYFNQQYTWMNDDYSGYESRITITVPISGPYVLRIRPFYAGSNGISNFRFNGNDYATNIPIQWTYVNVVNQSADGIERNYFTAKHEGEDLTTYDTYLWIEEGISLPGKILACNDDYYGGGGEFDWGYTSRIKKSFPSTIRTVWVNAYSQYSASTCDVYVKAPNSDIMSYFEFLNADDAIQSSPADWNYNCISWSGGIWDYWEWPDDPYSNFYDLINGDPLTSFDNYYGNKGNDGNPRYSGAESYYRNYTGNPVVDLWGFSEGNYTHGSASSVANSHPHGYDWESKPGSLMRTFHPRNALHGDDYGTVLNSYGYSSLKSTSVPTLKKSVEIGLSEVEIINLNNEEKSNIKNFKSKVKQEEITKFDDKFRIWKQTWDNPKIAICSNPKKYAESIEYTQLLEFCKEKGKASWPLVIEKLDEGDIFARFLLKDLTLKENQHLLNEVRMENKMNTYNENGAMLIRSPHANAMKYAKKLLAKEKIIDYYPAEYSPMTINLSPNPASDNIQIEVNCDYKMQVSITVLDISGIEKMQIVSSGICLAGKNLITANISQLSCGIYTCKVKGPVVKHIRFLINR